MSKIALSGNASGTGTLTIAAPNTNSDRVLNLPDSAGTIATAESTLAQFNASGSAPVYACRAWVNFNGTGTVAIRASGNVSSITDNGTGDYTVNFTTAMPDADYSSVATSTEYMAGAWTQLAGSCRVRVSYATNTGGAYAFVDNSTINVSIFR
jgi:hypothetical protein